MNLPLTAWQQAVILCIFIVFVGALLAWFGAQIKEMRFANERQQEKWQTFIGTENAKWQQFIREERITYGQSRKEDRDKMDQLEGAIARLAELVAAFRQDFNEHTVAEEARFEVLMTDAQKAEVALRASPRDVQRKERPKKNGS